MEHTSINVGDVLVSAVHLPDLIRHGLAPMANHQERPGSALDPGQDKTADHFLAETLERFKITSLNFEGNREFGDNAAVALARALKESPLNCLTHLNVANTWIHRSGLLALADALKYPECKITDLNLGGVWFSYETSTALADALTSPNCVISHLNLREARMSKAGLLKIVKGVNPKEPGWSSRLTHLTLEGIEEVDLEVRMTLADALKEAGCSLTHLNLNCCYDFEDDTSVIVDVLAQSRLKELMLAYSDIGKSTAIKLAAAMEEDSCQITRLDLRGNRLERTGPVLFAEALNKKPGLQIIV